MRCPFTPPRWWQRLVSGEFNTPQKLISAVRSDTSSVAVASDRFFEVPPDALLFDAPKRLTVHPSFFTGDAYLTQSHRADWASTDPRLMYWAAVFVELARKRNIPLYVHSALRGKHEQTALVASGASKAPYPRSAHNIGEAVDVVHSVFHWELSPQEWQLLRVIGRRALDLVNARLPKPRKLSLNWGGDEGPTDRFRWDPAHWELSDFRSRIRQVTASDPKRFTPRFILSNNRL